MVNTAAIAWFENVDSDFGEALLSQFHVIIYSIKKDRGSLSLDLFLFAAEIRSEAILGFFVIK